MDSRRALEQQEHEQTQAALEHHLEQLSQRAAEQFSQGVADWLLTVEELRQSLLVVSNSASSSQQNTDKPTTALLVTTEQLLAWQYHSIDPLLLQVTNLERWCADASLDERSRQTNRDLLAHCLSRAVAVVEQICQAITDHYITEPTTMIAANNNTPGDPSANGSSSSSHNEEEEDGATLRKDGQGAVARCTHALLILQRLYAHYYNNNNNNNNETTIRSIIGRYVEYQRQVLRNRAKPAIAALVRERRQGTFVSASSLPHNSSGTGVTAAGLAGAVVYRQSLDSSDDLLEKTPVDPLLQQHHAPTVTVILGQAATLIHPLAAWRNAIVMEEEEDLQSTGDNVVGQLCHDAIVTLDEQAQTLVRTVSDWFWQDRPVDPLLRQAAAGAEPNSHHHSDPQFLSRLDALVQEMADMCRILERYQHLQAAVRWEDQSPANNNNSNTIAELLQEWTLKYGALERYLTLEQCRTAWQEEAATPVVLVVGTLIRVSSVVEDAQYLCERALQRAAQTRSASAVASVAYAVAHEVWSTDLDETATTAEGASSSCSVYRALLEERGCWTTSTSNGTESAAGSSPRKTKSHGSSEIPAPPSSSGFASALLEALDGDDGPASPSKQSNTNRLPKAPVSSSGSNFLTSILQDREMQQQREQDTLCCVLNSLQAASGAARALVALLEGLLSPPDDEDDNFGEDSWLTPDDQATRLIRQAAQDLSLYSEAYNVLLRERICQAVQQWCGGPEADPDATGLHRSDGCLADLQRFWQTEEYKLTDGQQLQVAEADERLETRMLQPLRECPLLQQLARKCEAHVWQVTAEHLSTVAVELVLQSLWNDNPPSPKKKFTEWGALLLSKQVRLLQNMVCTTLWQQSALLSLEQNPVAVAQSTQPQLLLPIWERLWQVVTVLQLEKPSDWLLYHNPKNAVLTPEELERTLSLRVDFDPSAIPRVVDKVSGTTTRTTEKQPVHSNAQMQEQFAAKTMTTSAADK